MAAEVLARDLNLALYRIDLSSLVSKYISGQKAARRVRAAEQLAPYCCSTKPTHSASAAVGCHDRYADIEVGFLQQMEAFRGLTILTSNGATPPSGVTAVPDVRRAFPFHNERLGCRRRRAACRPAFPYGRASLMARAADRWQRSAMCRGLFRPADGEGEQERHRRGRTRARRSSAAVRSPRKATARSPDSLVRCRRHWLARTPTRTSRRRDCTPPPPPRPTDRGRATVSTCGVVLPSKQSTRRLACRWRLFPGPRQQDRRRAAGALAWSRLDQGQVAPVGRRLPRWRRSPAHLPVRAAPRPPGRPGEQRGDGGGGNSSLKTLHDST
jgi:hypothetical protein